MQNYSWLFLLLLGIVLLDLTAKERMLYIRDRVTVSSETVTLSDFVQNPELLRPEELVLEVFSWSSEETNRYLSLVSLASFLQRYQQLHDVLLSGPPNILLVRDDSLKVLSRFQQVLKLYLDQHQPWNQWECNVTLPPADCQFIKTLKDIQDFQVIEIDARRPIGSVRVRINGLNSKREAIQQFDFYPIIQRKMEVVVLSRNVEKGQILTRADVMIAPVWVSDDFSKYLTDIQSAVDRELMQSKNAGEILWSRELMNPIVVKRGDILWVTASIGNLSVQTSVKALQSGRIGELIRVENPASNKQFMVKIVGAKNAELTNL